jgi:hypothetical protein
MVDQYYRNQGFGGYFTKRVEKDWLDEDFDNPKSSLYLELREKKYIADRSQYPWLTSIMRKDGLYYFTVEDLMDIRRRLKERVSNIHPNMLQYLDDEIQRRYNWQRKYDP